MKNLWWGYLHVESTIQVKRAFDDIQLCLDEAQESPFVARVIEPFEADSREDAIQQIKNRIKK